MTHRPTRSAWIWRYLPILLVTVIMTQQTLAVDLFEPSRVQLLDGPFRHAQEVNREHLMAFDPDRLLAPYLTEAGLRPKAKGYPNWESSGLNGHTAGHYISALANLVATTDDAECRRRMDYMVAELARCQKANGNGYVGGIPGSRQLWDEVAAGNIRASGFGLNDRWVPWYNIHKTFAGLRDAYVVGGNEQARDVLIALTDWCAELVSDLSDQQMQDMLRSEHGGMNEVIADVGAITGEKKYLRLADRFNHEAILQPLVREQDHLNGLHANTQVPKVIGFERIAGLTGNAAYHRAARYFWDRVTDTRTLAFGGNSVSEHFPSPEQSMRFIESREGPETCNTYNMLRLSELLFSQEPEARYADFYERAMLNHILSTQHPEHGGYVYFTPARPRHYRVYSQPEQAFWCCVGSGMENHGRYGRFIYAHDDHDLWVNLFVASELDWSEKGITIRQETHFPDEPRTVLVFEVEQPTEFTLRVRHPQWVPEGQLKMAINGESTPIASVPQSYVEIPRTWQQGDRVEIELPMHIEAEPVPFLDTYVALMYGPVLLATETSADDLEGLLAGSGRMDHVAHGPLRALDTAPMLVAEEDQLDELVTPVTDAPLTFTAAEAIVPEEFQNLRLMPFFKVHDHRYMMYWRITDPAGYERVREEMAALEREQLRLDQATVDRVAPGEQQPETEHNFAGENTETGIWRDRRFRHASGWFSYDLNTRGKTDLELMVTYFGSDRREFDILINGRRLKSVSLRAPKPDEFMDVRYPIPASMIRAAEDGILTVRFQARPGSMAGGIFGVRLMEAE